MNKITKKILNIALAFSATSAIPVSLITTSCGGKHNNSINFDQLKTEAIDFFQKQVCSVGHTTYYWGAINKLLTEYAQKNFNATVNRDKYQPTGTKYDAEYWKKYEDYNGNIWFDVPATKDLEKVPTTILQAHMDMVPAIDTSKIKEYDFINKGIETKIEQVTDAKGVTREGIHSLDYKTTLGADDGHGIALIYTLISHANEFRHGKLRVLITADEEDGLLGAANLGIGLGKDGGKDTSKILDDCGYFINVDNSDCGNLIAGSGGMRYFWHNINKDVTSDKIRRNVKDIDSAFKKYDISVSDLLGGHSAVEIIGRANAIKLILMLYQKLYDSGDGNIEIIYGKTNTSVVNSIPVQCDMTIAADYTMEIIQEKINEVIQYVKDNYSRENKDFKFTVKESASTATKSLPGDESKMLFNFMNAFPYGPEEIKHEVAYSSANIGSLLMGVSTAEIDKNLPSQDGNFDFEFGSSNRSFNNERLAKYEADTKKLCVDHLGSEANCNMFANAPSFEWDEKTKGNNVLNDWLTDGFKKSNIKVETTYQPGGLELSYFTVQNDKMYLSSCGCSIKDEHNYTETWYLDTITPVLKSIVYALECTR